MAHIARVYRFHNKIAVHLAGGETVYLNQYQAEELSTALASCADECDPTSAISFQDSEFGTVEIK